MDHVRVFPIRRVYYARRGPFVSFRRGYRRLRFVSVVMVKLNIRTLILAGFAGILATILGVGLYAHSRLAETESHTTALSSDAVAGMYQSSLLKNALVNDYLRDRQGAEGKISSVEPLYPAFEATIFTDEDREAFDRFKRDYAAYRTALDGPADVLQARFRTVFEDASALTQGNHKRGLVKIGEIEKQIVSLQNSLNMGFLVALGVALLAGYFLMSVIIVPLKRLTGLMDTMREGDFTQRMPILRDDELGDLSDGFNRMADEVMQLVGHVQRSGIRVSTSMTEIAATSKQQQATAAEVAATTTQIGATSREIAVTSKELVRTMTDVASFPKPPRLWRRAGAAVWSKWRNHGAGHGGGQFDQFQAGDPQRKGRRYQSGGNHHHQSGRPDQPAFVERCDRGGKGGRIWARLCRGFIGNPPSGRSDRRCHL
jgi:HAMP domain-containing protein